MRGGGREGRKGGWALEKRPCPAWWSKLVPWSLTTLAVQDQFCLEFLVLVQGLTDLLADQLTGVWPVEEGAGTAPLHDLSPREAREITEAIRAIDHREEPCHLGVAQDEVAVCKRTPLMLTRQPKGASTCRPCFSKDLQPPSPAPQCCVCWRRLSLDTYLRISVLPGKPPAGRV